MNHHNPNGFNTEGDRQAQTGGLLPSISIENLCNQRDAIVERITQARALLLEGKAIFSTMCEGDLERYFRQAGYGSRGEVYNILAVEGLDHLLQSMDGQAWSYLLNQSGLRTFMDKKALAEWREAIVNQTTPPLTRENIAATFGGLYEDRQAMVERGMVELFRRLSWDYKTNNPVMLGKRIIVRGVTQYGGDCFCWSTLDELTDLERALRVLDGKRELDKREQCIDVRMRDAGSKHGGTLVTDYFSIRWYGKAGTGHITFTRPDLVERLNQIIAKHHPAALPAGR